jgi:hypothetical protein
MSEEDYMSLAERDDDDDDEEYRPQSSFLSPDPASFPNQSPKKRGRKPNPNPSIRSAREAVRKANHSVIEYVSTTTLSRCFCPIIADFIQKEEA